MWERPTPFPSFGINISLNDISNGRGTSVSEGHVGLEGDIPSSSSTSLLLLLPFGQGGNFGLQPSTGLAESATEPRT